MVKRKVQGVPQSQVAANLWHQEEEERDTNQHAQNQKSHESHNPALSSQCEVVAILFKKE